MSYKRINLNLKVLREIVDNGLREITIPFNKELQVKNKRRLSDIDMTLQYVIKVTDIIEQPNSLMVVKFVSGASKRTSQYITPNF